MPRTVDCDDGADAPPPESVRPAAPIARDEATGLGVWQTVAVRQVDDAAEASAEAHRRENADAARDKRDRQRREAAGSIDDRARQMCERAERVEALSSQLGIHDRTDEYRGIKLADDDAGAYYFRVADRAVVGELIRAIEAGGGDIRATPTFRERAAVPASPGGAARAALRRRRRRGFR